MLTTRFVSRTSKLHSVTLLRSFTSCQALTSRRFQIPGMKGEDPSGGAQPVLPPSEYFNRAKNPMTASEWQNLRTFLITIGGALSTIYIGAFMWRRMLWSFRSETTAAADEILKKLDLTAPFDCVQLEKDFARVFRRYPRLIGDLETYMIVDTVWSHRLGLPANSSVSRLLLPPPEYHHQSYDAQNGVIGESQNRTPQNADVFDSPAFNQWLAPYTAQGSLEEPVEDVFAFPYAVDGVQFEAQLLFPPGYHRALAALSVIANRPCCRALSLADIAAFGLDVAFRHCGGPRHLPWPAAVKVTTPAQRITALQKKDALMDDQATLLEKRQIASQIKEGMQLRDKDAGAKPTDILSNMKHHAMKRRHWSASHKNLQTDGNLWSDTSTRAPPSESAVSTKELIPRPRFLYGRRDYQVADEAGQQCGSRPHPRRILAQAVDRAATEWLSSLDFWSRLKFNLHWLKWWVRRHFSALFIASDCTKESRMWERQNAWQAMLVPAESLAEKILGHDTMDFHNLEASNPSLREQEPFCSRVFSFLNHTERIAIAQASWAACIVPSRSHLEPFGVLSTAVRPAGTGLPGGRLAVNVDGKPWLREILHQHLERESGMNEKEHKQTQKNASHWLTSNKALLAAAHELMHTTGAAYARTLSTAFVAICLADVAPETLIPIKAQAEGSADVSSRHDPAEVLKAKNSAPYFHPVRSI